MITIYEQGYEDFSTMGLGRLFPTACVIHEEQGGAYELELEHPMDEDGRYSLIIAGRVIRAPAPSRTTPLVTAGGLADREIYTANEKINLYSKATTSMGSTVTVSVPNLYDDRLISPVAVRFQDAYTTTKWKSNGNRIIGTVSTGAELIAVDKTNPSYYLVTTRLGVTGYVQASKVTYSKTESLEEQTIQARKTRDQPFRIYRIEKDTENLTVKAWARHVYYDLLGNVLINCAADGDTIGDALNEMALNCTQTDHGFRFGTDDTETTITADWSLKGMVEAQLDPDEGLASLGNLRVIRDNYDVFFVKRSNTARSPITYGRTLLGVRVDINEDAVINRIVPVGKTSAGDPLLIDTVYVDSPRNDAATMIRAKVIEYDVKVGDDYPTEADAKTELTARANADFEAGIDLPEVSVNVNMLQLGDTEEYQQYKDLDRLYLGDLIRVIDNVHGVDVEAEINEYEFDCLAARYTSLTIGVTDSMRLIGSVSGFMIPDAAVSRTKIVGGVGIKEIPPGAVGTDELADASVSSDKIVVSAVTPVHIKPDPHINLMPLAGWAQGSLNEGSNGVEIPSDTRIRCGYMPVTGGEVYVISRMRSGQAFYIFYNDANNQVSHSGAWVTDYPHVLTAPATATKLRAILRKQDNGTTAPEDVGAYYDFRLYKADQLRAAYPAGAVYLSEVSTPPGTLFGGTWASMTPPTGISYAWKRTA